MARPTRPIRQRIILEVDPALVHALKVRAAQEAVSMRDLVERWLRSWAKPEKHRAGRTS